MTLSLDARANILIAALLAISLAFIYWHTPAAAKTVVIRHEMAIVVKEKPQAAPSGGSTQSNKSAGPDSSEFDNQNSPNDEGDDDDDASPDPDESYQT